MGIFYFALKERCTSSCNIGNIIIGTLQYEIEVHVPVLQENCYFNKEMEVQEHKFYLGIYSAGSGSGSRTDFFSSSASSVYSSKTDQDHLPGPVLLYFY